MESANCAHPDWLSSTSGSKLSGEATNGSVRVNVHTNTRFHNWCAGITAGQMQRADRWLDLVRRSDAGRDGHRHFVVLGRGRPDKGERQYCTEDYTFLHVLIPNGF